MVIVVVIAVVIMRNSNGNSSANGNSNNGRDSNNNSHTKSSMVIVMAIVTVIVLVIVLVLKTEVAIVMVITKVIVAHRAPRRGMYRMSESERISAGQANRPDSLRASRHQNLSSQSQESHAAAVRSEPTPVWQLTSLHTWPPESWEPRRTQQASRRAS